MPIQINDKVFTSNTSPHYAYRADDGFWHVSWLPGQDLDRNAAITAMVIADLVAGDLPEAQIRLHIDGFAAELGLCCADAIVLCSAPPMYGLEITTDAGLGRDGMLASSPPHVLWLGSPEERTQFAGPHFVQSSHNMEEE